MIGEEIRRRRQELGLTGAQLAERADMAHSAVSQIETGRRIPSSTSVIKLAAALGTEPGELFPKVQGALFPLSDEQEQRRSSDSARRAYGGGEECDIIEGPVEYASAPLSEELRAIVMDSRDDIEARDMLFREADTPEARQQALATFVLAIASLIHDGRLVGERAADRLAVASKLQADIA